MSPVDFVRVGPSGVWTWIGERVWGLERAFDQARAGRREQDASYRIFFVLVLFATGFLTLAAVAVTASVTGQRDGGGVPPQAVARADLVDRNGQLLALDLIHYGAYLDPHDVWDAHETQSILVPALPPQARERVAKAFASGRRTYLIGGLRPNRRTGCMISACRACSSRKRIAASIPWARPARI